jgi:hypothetical protein
MEQYLFHGIKWYDFDLLMEILDSGYIMPKCMLKKGVITDENSKFVHLTQKISDDHGRSSYDELIYDNPCFVLKRDNLNLMDTCRINKEYLTPDDLHKIVFQDDENRYSCYDDVVHVKEKISLKDNLVAIGLPLTYLQENYDTMQMNHVFNGINIRCSKLGIDVPLLNSSDYEFADSEEAMKESRIILKKSL